MALRTSPEFPVHRSDKGTSRGYTDEDHPVARLGMAQLAKAVATYEETVYSLKDFLYNSGKEFVRALFNSNLFITGKVGIGELILDSLKDLITGLGESWQVRVIDIYTLTDLSRKARKAAQSKILVTIPVVEDYKALNKLISRALRRAMPVWFIGWPSLIGKHLLVSFDAFFVAADIPDEEIAALVGITPLEKQHIDKMSEVKADALFVAAYPMPQLVINGRIAGSIVYLKVD